MISHYCQSFKYSSEIHILEDTYAKYNSQFYTVRHHSVNRLKNPHRIGIFLTYFVLHCPIKSIGRATHIGHLAIVEMEAIAHCFSWYRDGLDRDGLFVDWYRPTKQFAVSSLGCQVLPFRDNLFSCAGYMFKVARSFSKKFNNNHAYHRSVETTVFENRYSRTVSKEQWPWFAAEDFYTFLKKREIRYIMPTPCHLATMDWLK